MPVHNVNTGLDYVGIQDAINAAETLNGHVIYAEAGTYSENVVVNKSLTLEGADKETTVIDGGGLENTLEVTADNVSITGFTIENSSKTFTSAAGCLLNNVTGCWITQNNIVDNWNGVVLDRCSGNLVSENTVAMNFNDGVSLQDSLDNSIYYNNLVNNTVQADVTPNYNNTWDNGYPSGGNYWNDHTERYPDAAEIDDSGVWNTPYVLGGDNQDSYPLMLLIGPPDTTAPIVYVSSPVSRVYSTANVPLTVTSNEPAARLSYSLDGSANVTLQANTTLNWLSNGPHRITVYATDKAGNVGFAAVHFTINVVVDTYPPDISVPYGNTQQGTTPVHSTTPPAVSVNSPQNKTYDTSSVPLTFTANGQVSWVGYSLDGQENVTITGNTTLAALPAGSHSLSVSVKDSDGNAGTSETVYFTVADQSGERPNLGPSQAGWVAAAAIVGAIAAATAFLVYFKKLKKK